MTEKLYINDLIDGLKVSPKMKEEFKAFNLAYYNNYTEGTIKPTVFWRVSPEYYVIEKTDGKDMQIAFSMLGLFFGPLAYFFRGMFVKGCTLLLPFLVLLLLLPKGSTSDTILTGAICVYSVYCAMMLRRDYFAHKCLNNNVIKSAIRSKELYFVPQDTADREKLICSSLEHVRGKVKLNAILIILGIFALILLVTTLIPNV